MTRRKVRSNVRLVYLSAVGAGKDATLVQLVEPVGPGTVSEFVESKGEGMHHLCFSVDDIDRTLADAAVATDSVFLGGRGRRARFLTDGPEGVFVELTETRQASDLVAR